jgi:asparagine synthetase B (glutamine-hydrolysing)
VRLPPSMSALEVAAGVPIGVEPAAPLPEVTLEPMAALEGVVADAVRDRPCCVAFSGGQDSSLLLAGAVRAAAKLGSPPPVALTMRFSAGTAADEVEWQKLVLDHLGVRKRIVVDVADDLDFVGPIAAAELSRRGVLFPANSHSLAPLFPYCDGGTLLVGLGGDELLGRRPWTRVNEVLAMRTRPTGRDLGRLAMAALPASLRARVLRRRRSPERRWLRPAASERARALELREAEEPVRFDRAVLHSARERIPVVSRQTLARLGEAAGIEIRAPLLDPLFVASLARAGGARGWGDRGAAMRAIAGHALPDAVLARRDKARFNATFFGDATRRFAKAWSGGGVDLSLVDPDTLRREWLAPDPDFRSALLLQIAWCHDELGDA